MATRLPEESAHLARIEKRVDEIAAAVVTLARVEERQTALFREHNRLAEAAAALNTRVASIEATAPERGTLAEMERRLAALEGAPRADPDGVADRLAEIERTTDRQGFAVRFGERLFWIVASSIAAGAASLVTFWTTKGH